RLGIHSSEATFLACLPTSPIGWRTTAKHRGITKVFLLDRSADITTRTVVQTPNRSYKSYLTYFIPPLRTAKEYFWNASRNVANFARRRLYQDFGMKELIERFYNSIRKGDPLPIPYREILLTARIMDRIFAQIDRRKTEDNERRESGVSLATCY